jgi:hypothetical protein
MAKAIKQVVTPMWLEIKEMYKKDTNGSDRYGKNFPLDGELRKKCDEFINLMGELTGRLGGYCVIEDIEMNLWKERIWSLVENAGLLPEISWRDDKEKDRLEAEKEKEKDDWDNSFDDDYDYDAEPIDLDSNKLVDIFI